MLNGMSNAFFKNTAFPCYMKRDSLEMSVKILSKTFNLEYLAKDVQMFIIL